MWFSISLLDLYRNKSTVFRQHNVHFLQKQGFWVMYPQSVGDLVSTLSQRFTTLFHYRSSSKRGRLSFSFFFLRQSKSWTRLAFKVQVYQRCRSRQGPLLYDHTHSVIALKRSKHRTSDDQHFHFQVDDEERKFGCSSQTTYKKEHYYSIMVI